VNDPDRFQLLFGPYRTPRFRNVERVTCQVRGSWVIDLLLGKE
jgi:hypothetical protein